MYARPPVKYVQLTSVSGESKIPRPRPNKIDTRTWSPYIYRYVSDKYIMLNLRKYWV